MLWRLLADEGHGPAWNMALDQAIFEAVEAGLAPSTLRLYEWSEPAVTIGRFQSVEKDLDLDFCREHGVQVVRRPTGGRGILHGADLTVSLAAAPAQIGSQTSVAATYAKLSEAFRLALRSLGVEAQQGTCDKPAGRSGDCFLVRSQADLVTEGGDKLVGSALRRTQGAILLQSSLRLRRDDVDRAKVFHGEQAPTSFPLEDFETEDVSAAIRDGFEALLGCRFAPGSVSGWEEERAAVLANRLLIA